MDDSSLQNATLAGADLNHASIVNANLSGSSMPNVDLRGADLTGASLDSAVLKDANLTGANLHKASLNNASMTGANLSGAILADVDLTTVNLRDADYSAGASRMPIEIQTKLRDHALWSESGGAEGKRAVLGLDELAGTDLEGIFLSGADLRACNLSGTRLVGDAPNHNCHRGPRTGLVSSLTCERRGAVPVT